MWILMRLVLGPPDVESGGHSYRCDFGKSLLKIIFSSNPPRFYVDENYLRSRNEELSDREECQRKVLKHVKVISIGR